MGGGGIPHIINLLTNSILLNQRIHIIARLLLLRGLSTFISIDFFTRQPCL